jgi:L-serine dehydratase
MDLFDLIGPVMIGPSSSHTAGAARIGLTARMLLNEDVRTAEIGFHGSFAKTYRGHGTDRAIVGGLMGMSVDDPRLRDSLALAKDAGMNVCFDTLNIRGAHPNTVQLTLEGVCGKKLTMEAASVGGGNIEIHKLNGLNVDFTGKEHTLIIHQTDAPGVIAAVTGALAGQSINIANMMVYRRKAGADAMMVLELDGAPAEYVLESLKHMNAVRNVTFLKRRPS